MAINIRKILSDGMLELSRSKSLEKITIAELLQRTGVSKTAFYNRFRDKYDLIDYIYVSLTHAPMDEESGEPLKDFYEYFRNYYEALADNKSFFLQASKMEGINSLQKFSLEYALQWREKAVRSILPDGTVLLPEETYFMKCFSAGTLSVMFRWIEQGMTTPPEEMARMHNALYHMIMDPILHKYGV